MYIYIYIFFTCSDLFIDLITRLDFFEIDSMKKNRICIRSIQLNINTKLIHNLHEQKSQIVDNHSNLRRSIVSNTSIQLEELIIDVLKKI